MCAVIKRGILGGFSNKIGNIVGTSWKGIAIMKSLPLSVANPRTAGQVTQRGLFGYASQFASFFLSTMVKPLWDRFAQQESGFNAFVKANINALNGGSGQSWADVVFSKGKLDQDSGISIVIDASADTIVVTRTSVAGTGLALSTDKIYMAFTDDAAVELGARQTVTRGIAGAQTDTYTGISFTAGTTVFVYLSWLRADGSIVSNSVAIQTVVVA